MHDSQFSPQAMSRGLLHTAALPLAPALSSDAFFLPERTEGQELLGLTELSVLEVASDANGQQHE